MIFRLLLLIGLPIAAFLLARSIGQRFSLAPKQRQLLFFLVAVLMAIAILVVMGRLPIHFILAPIGVAATFLLRMLPTLLRLLPMWQMIKSRVASSRPRDNNQTSTIRTEFLEMELRHSSGDMDGVVIKGSYAQRRLSSLDLSELLELLSECGIDVDSSQVLQAYIDRAHPDWREHSDQAGRHSAIADESVMTRELALEILGLDESAGEQDVVKTHRNLMQKMHPDRGGSDYLAKKINAAKDFLLED